jgi:tellurite methyltransferase
MLVADTLRSEASPLVRKFSLEMARAASARPILDVACGAGRNAIPLAELGCRVICIDRDLGRLKNQRLPRKISGLLTLVEMDLLTDPWPFEPGTIGGALMVDFLHPSLFGLLSRSLGAGACLLIETISARGGNYRELPKPDELRTAFETAFDFEFYRERKVESAPCDAVTVKLFGKRRANLVESSREVFEGGSR